MLSLLLAIPSRLVALNLGLLKKLLVFRLVSVETLCRTMFVARWSSLLTLVSLVPFLLEARNPSRVARLPRLSSSRPRELVQVKISDSDDLRALPSFRIPDSNNGLNESMSVCSGILAFRLLRVQNLMGPLDGANRRLTVRAWVSNPLDAAFGSVTLDRLFPTLVVNIGTFVPSTRLVTSRSAPAPFALAVFVMRLRWPSTDSETWTPMLGMGVLLVISMFSLIELAVNAHLVWTVLRELATGLGQLGWVGLLG